MDPENERLPFGRIRQVGIIVRDIDKAVAYYESLGIGPFEPSKVIATDRKVYGKPAGDVKNISRRTKANGVQYELVQPVEGNSVQREFLKKRGEGVNHLAFFVDDIDKETARMTRLGFKAISSGRFAGGGGFAYFDTNRIGGVIFELVQWPEGEQG